MFCFKKELNSRDGAWDKICTERDPFILCSLMWSWIEQLKEPIVSKGDIDMLAKNCTESQDALYLLRKVDIIYVNLFFNCQVRFVMCVKTIHLWPFRQGNCTFKKATSISLKIRMRIILVMNTMSGNQYYADEYYKKIPDTIFEHHSVEAQLQHISQQILQFETQMQK